MNRLTATLTCLLLLAGCKKDAPSESATPAQEATRATEAGKGAAPQAAKGAPLTHDGEQASEQAEDEGKLEVTPAVMDRFVTYWDREITIVFGGLKEIGDASKAMEESGNTTLAQGKAVAKVTEIADRTEALKQKALKDSGFTEAQVEYLRGLISAVAAGRFLIGNEGVDQKKLMEEMRKGVAGLPADQRAEAEKDLAEMEKGLNDLRDATEARQEYGDAAVDLVIRYEAKIKPLFKRTMDAAFEQ